MIAGTLAVLDQPADEPIEDYASSSHALSVGLSQSTHDDATPQSGTAATTVERKTTEVFIDDTGDGVEIDTSRVETLDDVAMGWYADVTGSGVMLAESVVEPTDEYPFPLDALGTQAGQRFERKSIDVGSLYTAWDDGGVLDEVWMAGSDEAAGTRIDYHAAAQASDAEPTIGLGFVREWEGRTYQGVVYASGYVALYDAATTSEALQFVADELLPHAQPWDPDEQVDQTDFDEFGGA